MSVERARALILQALAELPAVPGDPPVDPPPPPPPPPPTGPADYVIPSEWDWTRNLEPKPTIIVPPSGLVRIAFTTPARPGARAVIAIGADSGFNGSHKMTLDNRSIEGQTPTFALIVGPSIMSPPSPFTTPKVEVQGLLPSTRYVFTVQTRGGVGKTYHLNCNGAG